MEKEIILLKNLIQYHNGKKDGVVLSGSIIKSTPLGLYSNTPSDKIKGKGRYGGWLKDKNENVYELSDLVEGADYEIKYLRCEQSK